MISNYSITTLEIHSLCLPFAFYFKHFVEIKQNLILRVFKETAERTHLLENQLKRSNVTPSCKLCIELRAFNSNLNEWLFFYDTQPIAGFPH